MSAIAVHQQKVEWHQLALPFAALRIRTPNAIEALTRSIETHGQQVPVIVAADTRRWTLVDGYRRCEALRRTGCDAVWAELWQCDLAMGLLASFARGQSRPWHPIEEAGLIRELIDNQGLSQREIARRSGRDISWVSRRLALLESLPEAVLEAVRGGRLPSWAAARVMAPLARANSEHATRLLQAIEAEGISGRELQAWFAQYGRSHRGQRERLVEEPMWFIKSWRDQQRRRQAESLRQDPPGAWLADLREVSRRCERLRRGLPDAFAATLPDAQRRDLLEAYGQAEQRFAALGRDLAGYRP